MNPQLIVFPDDEWPARVAAMFGEFVRSRPEARIIVPTGATVEAFYAHAASMVPFERTTLLLLDEFGGLPEDDPGRCRSMIDRHLLRRLSARPSVHIPDVDGDITDAVARHRSLVEADVDLAIVGLGSNGHVGMNEPGSGAETPTRVVRLEPSTSAHAAEYGATEQPTWGITVGLREILDAEAVWLLVTGEHKRQILAKTLEGPISPAVPASQLRLHRRLAIIADRSATGYDVNDR